MMNDTDTSAATETPIYCPTCGRMKTVLGVLHTTRSFCQGCLCYRVFTTVKPVIHYSAGRSGHGKLAACGAKVWMRLGIAMAPSTSAVELVTCLACLGVSEAETYNS